MDHIKDSHQQVLEIYLPNGMRVVIDSDKLGVQIELWASSKVRLDCQFLYIDDGTLVLKP